MIEIVIAALVGAAVGVIADRVIAAAAGKSASQYAKQTKEEAGRRAEHLLKEAELSAKNEMIRMRDEFEAATEERRRAVQKEEAELKERDINLERKMDLVQKRLDEVSRRDEEAAKMMGRLREQEDDLSRLKTEQILRLETLAGMNREEARAALLESLQDQLSNERGTLIRRHAEEVKQRCQREAQHLLVDAMQRFAGECAYDRTTCTIPLPSDEMKGRIIGREGRNIRVFEAITGVNVLIDDTPSAVVISCFDPVRREIARLSLERLVADGRIHPTRVEEVVEKARTDIDDDLEKAGEDALHGLQITGVAPALAKTLGRLKYRYSYSQNVLTHSAEVARFMEMIAGELGLDRTLAKRMGLFHDIGKALDHEIEGSHAIIGMDYLKRTGESPEVCNAVGCHHGDKPAESPLAALVSVCDALSASRPGARSETTEIYLKRLEQLEEIGSSFKGVEQCYAVQAGREVRVVVEAEKVTENEAFDISRQMAQRIEEEMQYPGQIRICVIRETRCVEYAK